MRQIAVSGGTAYLGGGFSSLHLPPGFFSRHDPTTGALQGGGITATAPVHAVIGDGAGGYFAAGPFPGPVGLSSVSILHIFANGAVDPAFNATVVATGFLPSPSVQSLQRAGTTLFVAGQFTGCNGVARNGLAALDAATGSVLAFDAAILSTPTSNVTVRDVELVGGTVYFSGDFTTVQGQSRAGAAAAAFSSGALLPWDPMVIGSVSAIEGVPGGILLGGTFTAAGGAIASNTALVDAASGARVPSFNAPTDGAVRAFLSAAGTVFVGGSFGVIGGQPRSRVAAVDDTTGAVFSWTAPSVQSTAVVPATVVALSLSGSNLYIGGVFTDIGGAARRSAAALDAGTGQLLPWNPDLAPAGAFTLAAGGSEVSGLAAAPGGVAISGAFLGRSPRPRARLAAIDLATDSVTSWAPVADQEVRTIAVDHDTVYVAGPFTTLNGVPRAGLAAIDRQTGVLLPFDPQPDGAVSAIATDGTGVYVGGDFSMVGGQPRARIAALDPATGLALPFDPGASSTVKALLLEGSTLYAGGFFTTIAGQPRNYLAAIDVGTGLALPWNPGADLGVDTLLREGSSLYVGGTFTTMAGQPRSRVAEFDLATGGLTPFAPTVGGTVFGQLQVETIAIAGPRLFIGGFFSSVNGVARSSGAELDRATGTLAPWNPGVGTFVHDLAVAGNRLYIGSSASTIGGLDVGGFGRYPILGIASSLVLQPPCTSTPQGPVLGSNPPAFGTVQTYAVTQAPPLAPGALYLSFEPPGGGTFLLPGGCRLLLDLGTLAALSSFTTDNLGAWSLSIPIPPLPTLTDIRLRAAAVVTSPGGAVAGAFDMTETLELVIGL